MAQRDSTKRWNPLTGEWVIIAPATGVRPWSGEMVTPVTDNLPEFDPECYLCPGVKRAGGDVNPDYDGVFVFDNDFPSFSMGYSLKVDGRNGLNEHPARGVCRVVCFSPRHNLTLPEMDAKETLSILQTFSDQFAELSAIPEIGNVMIFENRGKVIGVSNPHPHGQIYSTDFIPRIPLAQYNSARKYLAENGTCLFCKVLEDELADGQRIVARNEHFAAYVPFFARLAYEIHIVSLRHISFITELTDDEMVSLADIYHEIIVRYDNLFRMPFPNITIMRNAPCAKDTDPEPYHFNIEFLPPLRSRDKLKYMAGLEAGGGNIINPSLPEESAEALRNVSTVHYSKEL